MEGQVPRRMSLDSNRWLDLASDAFMLQSVLQSLPPLVPSQRELRIQNSKLLRMLLEAPRSDTRALSFGGSSKKLRKRLEKQAHEISGQVRKVREQTDKYFKSLLRLSNPKLTNVQYRLWKKEFDSGMAEQRKRIKEAVDKRRVERLTQELTKPRSGFATLGAERHRK